MVENLPVDAVPGRRPEQWVVAEVREAYIHCNKHIPRLDRHRRRPVQRPAGRMSDYFGTAVRADLTG